ncbi:Bardet-Biedl syndrome 5 protein [Perkinsus chesapeaki]|uniref:Bardet-Biedl syndrome 5 protein n=1 Tax=Perkinsus chesapeaki TaxID=330153 RepID=A0A7J6LGA9_PERCH|nr:Bardet-Biedl syndrome 5 protein [Perkinsus chesapeaki]
MSETVMAKRSASSVAFEGSGNGVWQDLEIRFDLASSGLKLTRFNGQRFEFIFTSLVRNSPRIFTTMQAVHRAYDTSRFYRELRLRSAIVREQELVLLPQEKMYNKISGVWNLATDQGNLGTMVITNIRAVWYAALAENFNVSMPYLQMVVGRRRRLGRDALSESEPVGPAGGFVLGFRIDPESALTSVQEEMAKMRELFFQSPYFGVEVSMDAPIGGKGTSDARELLSAPPPLQRVEEDVEIDELIGFEKLLDGHQPASADEGDASLLYRDDSGYREPVYSPELGLAVAKLRDNNTITSLWNILAEAREGRPEIVPAKWERMDPEGTKPIGALPLRADRMHRRQIQRVVVVDPATLKGEGHFCHITDRPDEESSSWWTRWKVPVNRMPKTEITFKHHKEPKLADIWDKDAALDKRHFDYVANGPLEGWNGSDILWPMDSRTHDDVFDAFIWHYYRLSLITQHFVTTQDRGKTYPTTTFNVDHP